MRLIQLLFFSLALCGFLGAEEQAPEKSIEKAFKDPFSLQEPPPEVIDQSRFMGEFFYMLLMLAILISLVYFLAWFMRRMSNVRIDQYNESSSMKILERRQVSQRTTFYLMDIEGEKIVMAETPTTVVQLSLQKEKP